MARKTNEDLKTEVLTMAQSAGGRMNWEDVKNALANENEVRQVAKLIQRKELSIAVETGASGSVVFVLAE